MVSSVVVQLNFENITDSAVLKRLSHVDQTRMKGGYQRVFLSTENTPHTITTKPQFPYSVVGKYVTIDLTINDKAWFGILQT